MASTVSGRGGKRVPLTPTMPTAAAALRGPSALRLRERRTARTQKTTASQPRMCADPTISAQAATACEMDKENGSRLANSCEPRRASADSFASCSSFRTLDQDEELAEAPATPRSCGDHQDATLSPSCSLSPQAAWTTSAVAVEDAPLSRVSQQTPVSAPLELSAVEMGCRISSPRPGNQLLRRSRRLQAPPLESDARQTAHCEAALADLVITDMETDQPTSCTLESNHLTTRTLESNQLTTGPLKSSHGQSTTEGSHTQDGTAPPASDDLAVDLSTDPARSHSNQSNTHHELYGQLIHREPPVWETYKTPAENVAFKMTVWAMQRQLDDARVVAIAKDIRERQWKVPGTIKLFAFPDVSKPDLDHAQPNGIFDGQHRAKAVKFLLENDLDARRAAAEHRFFCVVDVYFVKSRQDIARLYETINRAESVHCADLYAATLLETQSDAEQAAVRAINEAVDALFQIPNFQEFDKFRKPNVRVEQLKTRLRNADIHKASWFKGSASLLDRILEINRIFATWPDDEFDYKHMQRPRKAGFFLGVHPTWVEEFIAQDQLPAPKAFAQ